MKNKATLLNFSPGVYFINMSTSFEDNFKQASLTIDGNKLTSTLIEMQDKLLLSVARNGEINVSYDLETPSFLDWKKPQRRYIFDEENEESRELNNTIVPKLLIGVPNMKMQVLASQIGLLISTLSSKNIILNISSKIFGDQLSEEYAETDFETLHQVLSLVKETFTSSRSK